MSGGKCCPVGGGRSEEERLGALFSSEIVLRNTEKVVKEGVRDDSDQRENEEEGPRRESRRKSASCGVKTREKQEVLL